MASAIIIAATLSWNVFTNADKYEAGYVFNGLNENSLSKCVVDNR